MLQCYTFPLTARVATAQLLRLVVALGSELPSPLEDCPWLIGVTLSVSKVKTLKFLTANLLPPEQGNLCATIHLPEPIPHGIRLGLTFSFLGPPPALFCFHHPLQVSPGNTPSKKYLHKSLHLPISRELNLRHYFHYLTI